MPFYHDGNSDFPHGAGASEPGWYAYVGAEPDGPFASWLGALAHAVWRRLQGG